jgi:hypothetical protein
MAAVRDVLQAHPDIACPGSPVAVVLDADEELVGFGIAGERRLELAHRVGA